MFSLTMFSLTMFSLIFHCCRWERHPSRTSFVESAIWSLARIYWRKEVSHEVIWLSVAPDIKWLSNVPTLSERWGYHCSWESLNQGLLFLRCFKSSTADSSSAMLYATYFLVPHCGENGKKLAFFALFFIFIQGTVRSRMFCCAVIVYGPASNRFGISIYGRLCSKKLSHSPRPIKIICV